MSRIEVRVQGLDALIARFGAAPQQVRRATRSAVARTARGLRASGRRELAASLQVPQRVIGDRVRLRLQMDAPQAGAVVWFGLEPLTVSRKRFGSLRQTRPGAVAAGRLFAGAFVVEKFGAAFRRV
ncbi:MAG: hypothetical protein RMJ98_23325, partial [Myxococcales bacterium]|nr:hypothetical protein [Myxococcales bacterium]